VNNLWISMLSKRIASRDSEYGDGVCNVLLDQFRELVDGLLTT
jgi:hypothetical protein